jgi:pyruvate formate lyase activating enzyme
VNQQGNSKLGSCNVTGVPLPSAMEPFSLSDVPGKMAVVIFFTGCNLNCKFCHNHRLIEPETARHLEKVGIDKIRSAIGRKGPVNSISVTGGEPLIKDGIDLFMGLLKRSIDQETDRDIYLNLDTNGMDPDRLKVIAPLFDKVSIDFKTTNKNFVELLRPAIKIDDYVNRVLSSISVAMNLGKDVDIRITYSPSWLLLADLMEIRDDIESTGFNGKVRLQSFSGRDVRDEARSFSIPSIDELKAAKNIFW